MLEKQLAEPIPTANGAQDGGVPQTIYEGFHDARIQVRGSYSRLGETVPRRFPRILAGEESSADYRRERPTAIGSLVGQPGQSAHGPSDGQPHLAASFRRRDRPLDEQLRQVGRAADKSRIARLPGRPVREAWLVDQSDAPRDHAFGHLPTVVDRRRRCDRARSRQSTCSARANRWRLESEAIRDNLLAVAGRLDLRSGGLRRAILPLRAAPSI